MKFECRRLLTYYEFSNLGYIRNAASSARASSLLATNAESATKHIVRKPGNTTRPICRISISVYMLHQASSYVACLLT